MNLMQQFNATTLTVVYLDILRVVKKQKYVSLPGYSDGENVLEYR